MFKCQSGHNSNWSRCRRNPVINTCTDWWKVAHIDLGLLLLSYLQWELNSIATPAKCDSSSAGEVKQTWKVCKLQWLKTGKKRLVVCTIATWQRAQRIRCRNDVNESLPLQQSQTSDMQTFEFYNSMKNDEVDRPTGSSAWITIITGCRFPVMAFLSLENSLPTLAISGWWELLYLVYWVPSLFYSLRVQKAMGALSS